MTILRPTTAPWDGTWGTGPQPFHVVDEVEQPTQRPPGKLRRLWRWAGRVYLKTMGAPR